jgi:Protein of unknown function (DUF2975)
MFVMLNHGSDDPAGAVFMGILITLGSIVTIAAAAMFERILQNGVDMKSENDLTASPEAGRGDDRSRREHADLT